MTSIVDPPTDGKSYHSDRWSQVVVDEDDFRLACHLVSNWRETSDGSDPQLIDRIAAAITDERQRARKPFRELFAGGPDTACRTTWRPDESMPECSAASIECCEVPMDDLRAAFGDDAR